MILIEEAGVQKVVATYYLERLENFKFMTKLRGEYPSLRTIRVEKRTVEDIKNFFNSKINACKDELKFFTNQLKAFEKEVGASVWRSLSVNILEVKNCSS